MAPPDFPAGGYVSDYLAFWAIWLLALGATALFFKRSRGRRGALRLVAGNLLVLVSLLWTGVLAAETYLRYVYDDTDAYALMLTNHAWFRRHVHLNEQGFRDVTYTTPKPPGAVRVACFGDSFTMGWGLREPRDTWPALVGAALAARSPGAFDVRNYGVPGHQTGNEIALLDERLPIDAIDHVILGYCLNDIDDLLPKDRTFDRETAPRVSWIEPTRSFLVDRLWFRLVLSRDPRVQGFFEWEKEAYDDPSVFGRQTDRFRAFAERCRVAHARLDVVVFPFFGDWGDTYRFASCHDRLVAAWRALGVEVIDLRDAYRGIPGTDLVVNSYDSHPNERAHALAAKTVMERVFGGK